jgi:hypothetical protein
MTTPTLLTKETINGEVFTSHRALYHTPSMRCGVRITYRVDGVIFPRAKWEHRRAEARAVAEIIAHTVADNVEG